MILIGQYDSPFVRRVGIALTLYDMPFLHRPWSTFGEGDKIVPYNPLRRVPTLILDDGSVIIESAYILDYLDEQRASNDDNSTLIARSGPLRRKTLYYIALAMGFSDKCVALFYERELHSVTSDVWLNRLNLQIGDVLDRLEAIRAEARTRWLFGDRLSHADIAFGCSLRHARDAHGDHIDWTKWPALAFHSAACEALDVFKQISQPFIGPSGD